MAFGLWPLLAFTYMPPSVHSALPLVCRTVVKGPRVKACKRMSEEEEEEEEEDFSLLPWAEKVHFPFCRCQKKRR